MKPNPALAKELLAVAEQIQRLTREHFNAQLKQELKDQARQKRHALLDGRKRDKTRRCDWPNLNK